MGKFPSEIQRPVNSSIGKKTLYSALIFITGVILGVISKVLDETSSNSLPYFLEELDLRNFFSRIGVWIFIAVVISVYCKSPVRSAVNVFLFFVGMVSSYYLYTVTIAGFFPKSYMMIWIVMTGISPFMAFVCWYAKGKGIFAISLSSIIIMLISRQAFAFGYWYFDILYGLELFLWLGMILVLYQSPKQITIVVAIGMLLYFLTAQISFPFGLL
ncbi:hypothetical protein [Cytobacillus sp.]|uniref:hypothetical protein n=1 Tax=Cytobacillus sp. TaxID=2675269 RepID=UPI0028BE2E6C|nr:hypothetical protein [Cytobacillus sp.]